MIAIILLLWCNCNQLHCREWSSYEWFFLLCYNLLFSLLRKCWFFGANGCVVQIWRRYLLVKEFIFTVEVAHSSWLKLLSGNLLCYYAYVHQFTLYSLLTSISRYLLRVKLCICLFVRSLLKLQICYLKKKRLLKYIYRKSET